MSHAREARPVVLVVDDKPNMLRLMTKVLRDDAVVRTAENGRQALVILEAEPVDVVLCDVRMPDLDGIAVLQASKRIRPRAQVILMTAYASVATAVDALRLGAYDYLTKPVDPESARAVVLRALGGGVDVDHLATAASSPGPDEVLPGVLAVSKAMHELAALVSRVAVSEATVVLQGETGTGKERLARAIHRLSPRQMHRFVAVSCAAVPEDLLESELFGHAMGSFPGATRDHAGLFEEANAGTLFLDEIGEMRLALQAKLARALEERATRRLGESVDRPLDVRLVVATDRDLEAMARAETFRRDLWYRLNVAVIKVPPLRERPEDIELLAGRFLRDRTVSNREPRPTGFSESALDALRHHDWPGNVRQLRAAIERAAGVASGERIEIGDLPPEVATRASATPEIGSLKWTEAMEKGRDEVARRYLEEVLHKHDGRVADAAAHAGVERESFYRLMRRYGIDPDARRGRRSSSPSGGS